MGPALFVAVLLVSTSDPGAASPLATYRGGEVSAREYADWLASQNLKDDPEKREGYLESAALAETLEAAAMANGLERDPAVRFRLGEAARGILVQAFERRENQAVRVSDAEVEAELLAERAELVKPRRVRLRNIFKKVPAGATPAQRDAVRNRMEQLRLRLLAGADFAEVAMQESDSQTRFQRGVMGAVPPGVLQPAVERVALGLKEGELSPVIETPDGFSVLRCDGIIEGRVMPLEEARPMIRQGLWRRRSEARQQALREELMREASVEVSLQAALDAGSDDAVAARFRGGMLTLADLRRLQGAPLGSQPPESLRRQIDEYVFRVSLAERARGEGVDSDPEVRARLRWTRARTLATFEITRRVNRVLVPPTPAELRAHFEANRQRYEQPQEMDVSVVELSLGTEGQRQALDEAGRLVERLRTAERDFAEAARTLSRHASAPSGGRLGWLTARQAAPLGPNVLRALSGAEPGQVVGPVQQDDALWVLKLWARRPPRPLTFEEARDRVEQELGDARVAEIQGRLEKEARKALDLRVATSPGP